jgi:hypothetical protein
MGRALSLRGELLHLPIQFAAFKREIVMLIPCLRRSQRYISSRDKEAASLFYSSGTSFVCPILTSTLISHPSFSFSSIHPVLVFFIPNPFPFPFRSRPNRRPTLDPIVWLTRPSDPTRSSSSRPSLSPLNDQTGWSASFLSPALFSSFFL